MKIHLAFVDFKQKRGIIKQTSFVSNLKLPDKPLMQLKVAKLSSKVDGVQSKIVLQLWLWGG